MGLSVPARSHIKALLVLLPKYAVFKRFVMQKPFRKWTSSVPSQELWFSLSKYCDGHSQVRMTLSEVILVWQLFNFPNGFVLGKIIIPEVIFWFGLVKITSGIIIIPNTNLFGKLNNYQTKITSDKVMLRRRPPYLVLPPKISNRGLKFPI